MLLITPVWSVGGDFCWQKSASVRHHNEHTGMYSPPRYLVFWFQSVQGLKPILQRKWYLGLICAQGGDVWTLSLFNPLRSDLFLESTDYCNPAEKHVQRQLYPGREQVILSKDKRNNTNYCVAGRGNLRKLVLIELCVPFKHHSTKQQGQGDKPRSYPSPKQSSWTKCTLSTNGIVLCMRSVPHLCLVSVIL